MSGASLQLWRLKMSPENCLASPGCQNYWALVVQGCTEKQHSWFGCSLAANFNKAVQCGEKPRLRSSSFCHLPAQSCAYELKHTLACRHPCTVSLMESKNCCVQSGCSLWRSVSPLQSFRYASACECVPPDFRTRKGQGNGMMLSISRSTLRHFRFKFLLNIFSKLSYLWTL